MILFKPWVGNEYCKQPLKILVVGESYYGMRAGDYDESFGIKAIEHYLYRLHFPEWKKARFHGVLWNTLKVFLNNDDIAEQFYNRISFCNYVQDMIPNTRWGILKYMRNDEAYKQHFFKTVQSLQPNVVVLTSVRFEEVWEYNGIVEDLNKMHIHFVAINHPSGRGYKIIEMQEKIKMALLK